MMAITVTSSVNVNPCGACFLNDVLHNETIGLARKSITCIFIFLNRELWSIVESKMFNGKPRTTILEYLGTADSLLGRLTSDDERTIRSYSHGDTAALLNIAEEFLVISAINEHIPALSSGKKPTRDGLTVGASLVLAAVGRVCKPTSKLGWYDWCKETSLSYALGKSLKDPDSQHFWDQMDSVPVESIALIEDRIVKKLITTYKIKLDKVFLIRPIFSHLLILQTLTATCLNEKKTNKSDMI
jgi:hypothetical protein